ncbi:N-acetylneuraminate synthase family protein [Paucihalobacter sp.]|uniref:N-acetylneuraminate synthase family protein n=1 Tax=Paucihalobacter sp. TaxID=2850405 RepID=UPI002FE35336
MYKKYLIAEIAQAHNGSFDKAMSYIKALSDTGVDAIKFQMHIADAESSLQEPFRIPMPGYASRMDYWRAMEFNIAQWGALKEQCEAHGMEFLCSPFSNIAVDILQQLQVQCYKVGSGEVNNGLLLERLSRTGKPIILSSGMSSLEELDHAVRFLRDKDSPVSVMQCTTAYPTQPEQYGLNMIRELKARYGIPVGFSDHSAHPETCLAAVALGAELLEFHVILDAHDTSGPDASSSLTVAQVRDLVKGVRRLERAMANPVDKTSATSFKDLKQIFEKSLAVNKHLPKGHVLGFEDLEAKKPKGFGIDARDYKRVVGHRLNKELRQWDFLTKHDISDDEIAASLRCSQ